MDFAIIGLGFFGRTLSRELESLGHDVLAIDRDEAQTTRVQDDVTRTIIADATNEEVLREFFYEGLDGVVVTIGTSIEDSLLVTLNVTSYDIEPVIVKAGQPEHSRILEQLGVDEVIHPEAESARRLAERIGHPSIRDYVNLRYGLTVSEVAIPAAYEGETLRELDLRGKFDIQVVAIKPRGETSMETIISPDRPLTEGDQLAVIGDKEDIEAFSTQLDDL